MTPAEIHKAYTDKTWLVWGREQVALVQVVDPEIVAGAFSDSCTVRMRNGGTPCAGIEYLRLATPQDLLLL